MWKKVGIINIPAVGPTAYATKRTSHLYTRAYAYGTLFGPFSVMPLSRLAKPGKLEGISAISQRRVKITATKQEKSLWDVRLCGCVRVRVPARNPFLHPWGPPRHVFSSTSTFPNYSNSSVIIDLFWCPCVLSCNKTDWCCTDDDSAGNPAAVNPDRHCHYI